MLEFLWPWVFALAPLPIFSYYLLPKVRRLQHASLLVTFIDDFSTEHSATDRTSADRWLALFTFCIWLLLLTAAARPQWVGDPIELPVSGRDLMMAIDLSFSMQEDDFFINNTRVDRLTATKIVASDFIERRKGDRIGLILFGDRAYVQTPLTFDRATVTTLLKEAALGLAGQKTAIGDAIGLAVKRLKEKSDNQKVLILLTDGANTAGELSPEVAADLAQKTGMKIYTIGVGADERLERDFFGRVRRTNPSRDLDEKTLTMIADKTGGRYFRARDTQQLESIYAMLDELEPVDRESQSFRPTRAYFYWPLGCALLLTGLLLSYHIARPRQ